MSSEEDVSIHCDRPTIVKQTENCLPNRRADTTFTGQTVTQTVVNSTSLLSPL